jgi:four helix bundle protein
MNRDDFKQKTKEFAINTALFCQGLPYNSISIVYIKQLVRCSSSVGANYRAACRAKSSADFINKMRIVEEEADESMFFLELLEVFHPEQKEKIRPLHSEADHIVAITVKSINTVLHRTGKKAAN